MERKNAKQLKKSFEKTLLDTPVPLLSYSKKSKRIKALPPPLIPTTYVPPPPVPNKGKLRPFAMPRSLVKKVPEKIKKIIDTIKPYFKPEAVRKFNKELRDKKNLMDSKKITEKARALRVASSKYHLQLCKIEKSKILKLCHNKGFWYLITEI